MTDEDLDNAVIAALAVRRAEFNIGRANGAAMTTRELAEEIGQPVARVATRLDLLAAAGRVLDPARHDRRWISARAADARAAGSNSAQAHAARLTPS